MRHIWLTAWIVVALMVTNLITYFVSFHYCHPKIDRSRMFSWHSPNFGGHAAILLGVRDSVNGWPTRRM